MNLRNYLILGSIAVIAALLAASEVMYSTMAAPSDNNGKGNGTGNSNSDDSASTAMLFKLNRKYMDYHDGVFKVKAGVGNGIAPITQFFPQVANIKVGEKVMWYNPTRVGEPHTVSINGFADIAGPFIMSNSSAITPLNATANAAPVIIPAVPGKTVGVVMNARSVEPVVIAANGTVTYLPPNANYTMNGDEKYINSGWIWPQGQTPPGFPNINSFTVQFNKAGTYGYICEVHPWMTGKVVVR
jgi:plastocyanin